MFFPVFSGFFSSFCPFKQNIHSHTVYVGYECVCVERLYIYIYIERDRQRDKETETEDKERRRETC